ncbi:MAG: FkbM family methyltransferase [Gammaproteobacteria bacterium]|jgi:FkbM family methyltransferase
MARQTCATQWSQERQSLRIRSRGNVRAQHHGRFCAATNRSTKPEGNIDVKTASMDALLSVGATPPTVIKIDIEGGEYAALLGGTKLLRGYRPAIFLSTHGPQDTRAKWHAPLP